MIITSYYDSNWGGDLDSRKSTIGYVFIFGSTIVNWSNKRQPTIMLSITKAKYMLASQAVRDAMWLQRLLNEFGFA
jgi:hypothetical protein